MLERRALLRLFWAPLGVKLLILALDHTPGFQFGDSASYLQTALTGWIPPDRSFVYGFLLRPCLAAHSLGPLLLVQALLSAIAAWLAGFCLQRYWQANLPVTIVATLACALDPLQLLFERFVMTEALATFGFALLFTLVLEYLRSRRTLLLLPISLLAASLVSIRFSFLPLATVLPLLVFLTTRHPLRRSLLHFAILALCVQTLLFGYRHLYGHLSGNPPAFLSHDGFFVLADVSPLVVPNDIPLPDQRTAIFQHLSLSRTDPEFRLKNRWSPQGLCHLILEAAAGDERTANRIARQTALAAVKRDPLGVLGLGVRTYLDFFHAGPMRHGLLLDQGQLVEPSEAARQMIVQTFGISLAGDRFGSFTRRWELHAAPWCWLVLLSPLVVASCSLLQRRLTAADAFAQICSWILLAGAVLPTELANPRYLLPLTWLASITVATLFLRPAPDPRT